MDDSSLLSPAYYFLLENHSYRLLPSPERLRLLHPPRRLIAKAFLVCTNRRPPLPRPLACSEWAYLPLEFECSPPASLQAQNFLRYRRQQRLHSPSFASPNLLSTTMVLLLLLLLPRYHHLLSLSSCYRRTFCASLSSASLS